MNSVAWFVFRCLPVYVCTCLRSARFAFEQVNCGGVRIGFSKDARVARIVWIRGRVSLDDALLLAGEFERVEEEGNAEDTESGGE